MRGRPNMRRGWTLKGGGAGQRDGKRGGGCRRRLQAGDSPNHCLQILIDPSQGRQEGAQHRLGNRREAPGPGVETLVAWTCPFEIDHVRPGCQGIRWRVIDALLQQEPLRPVRGPGQPFQQPGHDERSPVAVPRKDESWNQAERDLATTAVRTQDLTADIASPGRDVPRVATVLRQLTVAERACVNPITYEPWILPVGLVVDAVDG